MLRIKIIALEEPYLWYKNDVGKEFDALDFRYEDTYKIVDSSGERVGYIKRKYCEIISIIQVRQVPEFPFLVKILKNSWFPQCWYANRIGEIFKVINGSITNDWRTTHPNGNPANIRKEDCEIIKQDDSKN